MDLGWDRLQASSLCSQSQCFDVLSQPVFDEFSDFLSDGKDSACNSFHESQMSSSVVSNVMLVVQNLGEEILFIGKVLVVQVHQFVPSSLIPRISLHLSNNIKEPNMFIIHLFDVNTERGVPDIRVRYNVVSSHIQFSSVGMISVLDVLGEPVLGPADNFLIQGNLG